MLDVGFSELLLIAVVGLIVIGPKDLPVVIRSLRKVIREFSEVYNGLKRQVTEVIDESELRELNKNLTTIIDLEGKPQQAYDVRDLESMRAPKPPEVKE